MKRLLIAACFLFAQGWVAAAGTPAAPALRSAVDLSVRATADAGVFEVTAVITDLADDTVLASPVLLVRDGEEGSVRVGRGDRDDASLSVRVDGAERKLRWHSELRVGGEVMSRQSAQIALP